MVAVIHSSELRKRKNLKKGIQFTLMVVGQSGTGRSTFINSLCGQDVLQVSSTADAHIEEKDADSAVPELKLRTESVELEDAEGIKISLSIIDTPGFGDNLDNEDSFYVLTDYIKSQYDEILLEESRVRRNPRFKDGRVHAVLYFIVPTGHGLREIDVEVMTRLGKLSNVIPVISKSDSLTVDELQLNKKLIREDIKYYDIPIYDFPYDLNYDDEETIEANTYLKTLLPFAVVGSNETYTDEETGTLIRARKYPWGSINIEDPELSDFVVLRNTLLISHLQDLKEHTHDVLYEKFRTEALSDLQDEKDGDFSTTEAANTSASRNVSSPTLKSTAGAVAAKANVGKGFLAREEQIKLEEERLREYEEKVEQELLKKRQQLLDRERELKEMEERLVKERLQSPAISTNNDQFSPI